MELLEELPLGGNSRDGKLTVAVLDDGCMTITLSGGPLLDGSISVILHQEVTRVALIHRQTDRESFQRSIDKRGHAMLLFAGCMHAQQGMSYSRPPVADTLHDALVKRLEDMQQEEMQIMMTPNPALGGYDPRIGSGGNRAERRRRKRGN